MMPLNRWLSLLIVLSWGGCSTPEARYPGPLTPDEALARFELRDGFRIELFAAEPHVMDPVELAFDEQGRAFVVEMPDYPYKPEPGGARGRIRLLEDTDGDGQIDRNTLFADRLSEATSALPWQGGLLVTAAPDMLYLKDTDGDGQADARDVLFTGFFEHNSEAQITNLRFSVDNWIYGSNFGQPGAVTFTRAPETPPLALRGGDFRFRLDRNLFEVAAGPTQFGQALDDWGRRFATQNTWHISHLVLPWRYLHRHPYLPETVTRLNISDHDLRMFQRTPPPYWRAVRTERRQQRYDEAGTGQVEYAADHFTGASGGTIYDGDLFPAAYYGNVFTGDVAGNLIHRDVLIPLPESPTFVAQRAPGEHDREFLASTDPWFRPASFTVGPDGALYVVDMYRQHIETPLSIPEDLKADMDFYHGDDRGRIYRIVPDNAATTMPPPLARAETAVLVQTLAHAGGWWRRTAHRLLLERQDAAAIPLLQTLFAHPPTPQARLHALYALEGLAALDAQTVHQALQDPHPGIRIHAMQHAEALQTGGSVLSALVDDPDPRVALQAALSLGAFPKNEALSALARYAARHAGDPWMRLGLLSSEAGSSLELLERLDNTHTFFASTDSARLALLTDLAIIVAKRNTEGEIVRLLQVLTTRSALQEESWQVAGLSGLLEGLKDRDPPASLSPEAQAVLAALQNSPSEQVRALADQVRAQSSESLSPDDG